MSLKDTKSLLKIPPKTKHHIIIKTRHRRKPPKRREVKYKRGTIAQAHCQGAEAVEELKAGYYHIDVK